MNGRGYVGERTPSATEYYSHDFEWDSCREEGEKAIERQLYEYNNKEINTTAKEGEEKAVDRDEAAFDISLSPWEGFHQKHQAARFFKEKRYVMLEFPILVQQQSTRETLHVAEIGCGCGSALLPILKSNHNTRVTACDISATAISLFIDAAWKAGIDASTRINAFVYDAASSTTDITTTDITTTDISTTTTDISTTDISITTTDISTTTTTTTDISATTAAATMRCPLDGINADCLLMIFTLSALHPDAMKTMLSHAFHALRPGGLLLFRDYGKYDMAQLRFRGAHIVDPEKMVYKREDGTLSYFFTPEELSNLMECSGFECVEAEYATTCLKNKKKDVDMKRVFVHGVFRKKMV